MATTPGRPAAAGGGPESYGPWGPAALPRDERAAEALIADRALAVVIDQLGEQGAFAAGPEERAEVRRTVEGIVAEYGRWAGQVEGGAYLIGDATATVDRVLDELLGLGLIQPLMDDPAVEEITINSPTRIFAYRPEKGREKGLWFDSPAKLLRFAKRLALLGGARLDESAPDVDFTLPDGSRANITIPPAAVDFPCITIRKFLLRANSLADLVALDSLPQDAADFLGAAFRARANLLISGATGSGKTTFINSVGVELDGERERLITIEENPELQLARVLPDALAFQARRENLEGAGGTTIRDLVRSALRKRPTRIIVGEVRGAEALDMLLAMNTGHDGSACTIHANDPRQALDKLATYALMAGEKLPLLALYKMITQTIEIVVQLERDPVAGRRRVSHIFEVTGIEGETIGGQDLWLLDPGGERLRWTGTRPRALDKIARAGIAYGLPRDP